ncbi:MAG: hypothetical protein QW802_03490 [Candidatus Altiarchaeota archaeon]
MNFLDIFISQLVVLGLMLIGMIIGDSIAISIFGKIKGVSKQLLYFFLFVVFLVIGNYIPSFLGIPNLSLFSAMVIFGFWGFSAVFFSRAILHLITFFVNLMKKALGKKSEGIEIDAIILVRYLSNKGVNSSYIGEILSDTTSLSKKKADKILEKFNKGEKVKEKIKVNPHLLTSKLSKKMDLDNILEMLVTIFKFSPERAVKIWREST